MAYQAVSTTLPKGVVVVLLVKPRIFTGGYQNTEPKDEVQHLVAYHYSPVGGHTGQLDT